MGVAAARLARLVLLIGGALLLRDAVLADTRPSGGQPGYFELGLSTRVFDSPLFDGASTGTYRLFARQSLFEDGDATAWFSDGFPNYVSDFGIAATGVPFRGSRVDAVGGDFVLGPLRPASFFTVSRDTYPLRGMSIRVADGNGEWGAFAGAAKYFLPPPDRAWQVPSLAGVQRLVDRGADHFGVALTGIADATYLEPGKEGGTGAVLTGDYFRDLSASAKLFLEGMSTSSGDPAGRFGLQLRNPRWDLSAGAYAFGDGFPFVSPLYLPGERGLEVAGRFDPAYRWSLSGYGDYVHDSLRFGRAELRGDLGVAWSPGGSLPHLRLDYARNEVSYDSTSISTPGATSDRVVFLAARSYASQFWSLRAEHVLRDASGVPERSQATFDFRRVALADSFVTGTAVLQRSSGGDLGATAESAIERPFRPDWSYIAGLGAAWTRIAGEPAGEGVLRAGVAHRFSREGWYARLEVRVPFSIGSQRADLTTQTVSFDLGSRIGWRGRSEPRRGFEPSANEAWGTVEGSVTLDGSGVPGVRLLLDGEPAATTGSGGRFRIRKVRAGQADLSVDLRNVDPRFSVRGGTTRRIEVLGRGSTHADFVVEPRSYLQGTLLACEAGRLVPVRGARLTLAEGAFARTVETSPLGSFQIDEIPPGVYSLTLDAGTGSPRASGFSSPVRIDQSEDVRGYVIRRPCDPPPAIH